jgi:hypothetical protein
VFAPDVLNMDDVKKYGDAFGGNAYYFIKGINDYEAKAANAKSLMENWGISENDAWGGHTEAYWQEVQRQFDAGMHPTTESVKGFAAGGAHAGGWRLVGENGPELEYTGASRVISHGDATRMLDNAGLEEQFSQMRRELVSGILTLANHSSRAAKVLEDWDQNGAPPDRSETPTS